jgi:hypothetical protein
VRVQLTITLDLPDTCLDFSEAELGQLLFDEYVHYVTCSHLADALTWCAEARVGQPDEDPAKREIYEHHQLWAAISDHVQWTFEVTDG